MNALTAVRSLISITRPAPCFAAVTVCLLCAAAPARAATLSWSGAGTSGNWSDIANWGFAGTPTNGDILIFPAAQPRLNNTNNIAGLTLNQIRFVGASGGYTVSGNAFTLTNGILATNTSGVNGLSNNITIATADIPVVVSNGVSLVLGGVLGGSMGLVKSGTGTLQLSGAAGNTYTGTTTVNGGLLELNKSVGDAIASGSLVIGDGVGGADSDIVRSLTTTVIAAIPVQVNSSGLLDLNGFSDAIGSLTLSGGRVTTGVGTLTMGGDLTSLASPTTSTVSGNLSLGGVTRAFSVASGAASPDLTIAAVISGTGGAGINKTSAGQMTLSGANTYTGPTTINGFVILAADSALGANGFATNGTTVNAGGVLLVQGVDIGNEFLTLAGGVDYRSSGTASWAGPITLNGIVAINPFGGTFTNSGVMSGSGGFTKSQTGTLILSGSDPNSFAGAVAVNQGQLHLNKIAATAIPPTAASLTIGDGLGGASVDVVRELSTGNIHNLVPIIINGSGQLDLNNFDDEVGIGGITLNGGNIITGTGVMWLDGNVTVTDSTNVASISGVVRLTGTRTFDVADDPGFIPDLSVTATVVGVGGITKIGAGILHLAVSNSFTGAVIINDGFIRASDNFSLGTVAGGVAVNGDGGLQLDSAHVGAEALTLNSSAATALQAISGSNSWSGAITLSTSAGISPNLGSDTLNLLGVIAGAGGVNKNALGTLYYSGAGANIYAGVTTVNVGTLVLAKSVANVALTNSLIVGDNVGGVNADVVRTELSEQLPNTVAVTVNSSGLIEFNTAEFFGSLAGAGNVTLNTGISVGYDNSTTTFSGVASGIGSFNKYGTGTMILTGNNAHTAATTANEGILRINGFQPQSIVAVGAAGTLNGTGVIGGLNNGGGGVVSPGSPGTSPGILTCSNVMFSGAGSDFNVEINGPTPGTHDHLNARGSVSLGNCTLNLTASYAGVAGQSFVIISNDAAEAIVGTFNGLAEGAVKSSGLLNYRISYVGGSGNDVTLTTTNPPLKGLVGLVAAGNGDSSIDPNECNLLYLVITNTTGAAISNVFAQLSTSSDHVVMHQNLSDYPPLPANGTGTNLIPFQLSTLPALACGSNIVLQLNISFAAGSLGSVGATFTLPTGHPGPASLVTNNSFLTIPDDTVVESTNAVSGITGPIAKVRVSVHLTHPNDGDLALRLIAPDGTLVVLSDFNGGPGDHYGADCAPGSYTVFDDAAATSITGGSPPYVGTFRPEGALASFIGKSGADVNGNWRLQVEDDLFGGATGTLRCWVLEISPLACAAGSGNCDTCPGAVTNSITNGDLINPDRISRSGTPGTCAAPLSCNGAFSDTGPYHYDTYTFTNAGFTACVTVYLDTSCADALSASAYVGSYVPTNVCQNFLAEMGSIPSKTFDSFSFVVPGGTNFVIVVNEVFAGAGCDYTMMLTGLQCPRPVLNITPVPANQVKLDWTTAAVGYNLERTNTLVTGVLNWPPVTNDPVVVSGRFTVTNNVTGTTNNFYRLKQRLFD